jgi:hypothetical protein
MASPPTKYYEDLPSGSIVTGVGGNRQTGDLISLLSCLESRLKASYRLFIFCSFNYAFSVIYTI